MKMITDADKEYSYPTLQKNCCTNLFPFKLHYVYQTLRGKTDATVQHKIGLAWPNFKKGTILTSCYLIVFTLHKAVSI